MRILKQSERAKARVSLILTDWSVRESVHILHYLAKQAADRDSFEVVMIEYYDHVSKAVQAFEDQVDSWVLLQMPGDCYYHKHLMYNAGIMFSHGDILMFGDSDAMVRPTFINRIIESFDRDPRLVYHMDEFRNVRRDFYPFNYPSFADVVGEGCINNVNGKTKGVLDAVDPIHTRNYGACMCGRKEDLLAIGGADEDLTYLGHICGPYDMTFRLMNLGRRLVWDTDEYLYHTWHPGSDGVDNYLGPHDGMNMSTTALQALSSGRIQPLVENRAIAELRANRSCKLTPNVMDRLIDSAYRQDFSRTKLGGAAKKRIPTTPKKPVFGSYKGFDVYRVGEVFYGVPENMACNPLEKGWRPGEQVITAGSFSEIRDELDRSEARFVETAVNANICSVGSRYAIIPHSLGAVDFRIRKQRENPAIVWADDLAQARNAAIMLYKREHGHTSGAAATAAAVALYPKNGEQDPSLLTLRMDLLNARLARLEADVANIYQSRIWRTLVRVGGLINKVMGKSA